MLHVLAILVGLATGGGIWLLQRGFELVQLSYWEGALGGFASGGCRSSGNRGGHQSAAGRNLPVKQTGRDVYRALLVLARSLAPQQLATWLNRS